MPVVSESRSSLIDELSSSSGERGVGGAGPAGGDNGEAIAGASGGGMVDVVSSGDGDGSSSAGRPTFRARRVDMRKKRGLAAGCCGRESKNEKHSERKDAPPGLAGKETRTGVSFASFLGTNVDLPPLIISTDRISRAWASRLLERSFTWAQKSKSK